MQLGWDRMNPTDRSCDAASDRSDPSELAPLVSLTPDPSDLSGPPDPSAEPSVRQEKAGGALRWNGGSGESTEDCCKETLTDRELRRLNLQKEAR